MSYYDDILEEERSLNNKLYSMNTSGFWTNSVVHAVIVGVVLVGGYALTAGGEWQTVTLGALATGILSFLKGKALLGK